MDRLLWYVFAGSRGGPTRVRMMMALLERPHNTHELAKRMGLDYKTVEYNLRVLTKHVYVVKASPEGYGTLYAPSKNLLAGRAEFDVIASSLKSAPKKPGRTPAGAADVGKGLSDDPAREATR